MEFDPSNYVRRGSPDDNFPDGIAEIAPCRCCGIVLLIAPEDDADCGRHLN